MRRIFNFLTGGIIGALVGGVAILLMTPTSGDELRGEARSRFDRFLTEIQKAATERRSELEAQLDELKQGSGSQ